MAYNTTMEELVPFQAKRGKTFPPGTTQAQAIKLEFEKHFKKAFPDFVFGEATVTVVSTQALGKQTITGQVSMESLINAFINLIQSTLPNLETLMLIVRQIAIKLDVKRPYLVLPKPYQKVIKRTYSSQKTLDVLAAELQSKSRAKKYLRILQKRIGTYTEKKRPFV